MIGYNHFVLKYAQYNPIFSYPVPLAVECYGRCVKWLVGAKPDSEPGQAATMLHYSYTTLTLSYDGTKPTI